MASLNLLQLHRQNVELPGGRRLQLFDILAKDPFTTVRRALLRSPSGVERLVAVKLFTNVSSEDRERFRALLVHTARRAAWIDHPNVVRVYEYGEWRGQPFLVVELVPGLSLGALADVYASKRRRLPLDLALFVACEVAEGLAGAHVARDAEGVELGMVHHALSAREVLLSWRGEVKVTDFEVSTARAASSGIRSLHAVAVRATTMPPEVAQGATGDVRSDVFAFGLLLRQLLVGPRFSASLTSGEILRLVREGYVEPMTFQPHLPYGLERIIARAIEIDPDARYPHAGAMAADLRRVALAMGVGDGRYFLSKALERELSRSAAEIAAAKSAGAITSGASHVPELALVQKRRT